MSRTLFWFEMLRVGPASWPVFRFIGDEETIHDLIRRYAPDDPGAHDVSSWDGGDLVYVDLDIAFDLDVDDHRVSCENAIEALVMELG